MKNSSFFICVCILFMFGTSAQGQVRDTINSAADELVVQQTVAGGWTGEDDFMGSIVPGLVSAYEVKGKAEYKTAAELGGSYIISIAGGNYYGDEAYALTRLSDLAADPLDNAWRTTVANFYEAVRMNEGGTEAYIFGYYYHIDASTAVIYLAHHVLAAYYVDAVDKEIWRNSLIDYLSYVSDEYPGGRWGRYPVLSLGVATWALAKTGPLDPYIWVRPGPAGWPYWDGVTLADLPDLLLGHQVPQGQEYAGSFYWRFDHEPRDTFKSSGYTEDTAFSVLGLVAAAEREGTHEYDAAVLAAREVMPIAVEDPSAKVYTHIWLKSGTDIVSTHFYAGELLQALGAVSPPGDSDDDGDVDILDLYRFSLQWLNTGCTYSEWCGRADLNFSGTVDFVDYAKFAKNYQKFTDK